MARTTTRDDNDADYLRPVGCATCGDWFDPEKCCTCLVYHPRHYRCCSACEGEDPELDLTMLPVALLSLNGETDTTVFGQPARMFVVSVYPLTIMNEELRTTVSDYVSSICPDTCDVVGIGWHDKPIPQIDS